MVEIKGSAISSNPALEPKCTPLVKPIKRKRISLSNIGTPPNNILVDLLRCQCRVKKTERCSSLVKSYSVCHGNVMGTGQYQGRSNCGDELEALYMYALVVPPAIPTGASATEN
uniref:Uncharacterized protein n=1 Tax=Proboscia inermis TaxID=420281 RepID=A0A7S0C4A7_9STRA|mmetsp:Transcript_26172/g.26563  ORF Transcript_26172/g.26563 Transcript_26172/m.26563 type:complete len:114 (+) Transcript_26172:78-419(+)